MGARRIDTLIFDLDGTLVDSAPAILACMEATVACAGYTPVVRVDSSLIGPPLRATLARITGLADTATIEMLAVDFMRRYDEQAAGITLAFPGIEDMLAALGARGIRLHLATNKRLVPTLRILDARGWSPLFASVYAQDKTQGGYPSKAAMIAHLLREQSLAVPGTAYVGDTREDGLSATENGLAFIAALWGYGGDADAWRVPGQWARAADPAGIVANLAVT